MDRFKLGLSTAAFVGIPAALGAAGGEVGNKSGFKDGGLLGKALASGVAAPTYGFTHGTIGAASLNSENGGLGMLTFIAVPLGAGLGTVAGLGLGVAGAVGGYKVAVGLAGAGFLLGAYLG